TTSIHLVLSGVGGEYGIARQELAHEAQHGCWSETGPTGRDGRLLALAEGRQILRTPAPTRLEQGPQRLQGRANVAYEFLKWVHEAVLVRHAVDVEHTLAIGPDPRLK